MVTAWISLWTETKRHILSLISSYSAQNFVLLTFFWPCMPLTRFYFKIQSIYCAVQQGSKVVSATKFFYFSSVLCMLLEIAVKSICIYPSAMLWPKVQLDWLLCGCEQQLWLPWMAAMRKDGEFNRFSRIRGRQKVLKNLIFCTIKVKPVVIYKSH